MRVSSAGECRKGGFAPEPRRNHLRSSPSPSQPGQHTPTSSLAMGRSNGVRRAPFHDQPSTAQLTTSVGTTWASNMTTARQPQHIALLRCTDPPMMPTCCRPRATTSSARRIPRAAAIQSFLLAAARGGTTPAADTAQASAAALSGDTAQRPRCAARPRATNASGTPPVGKAGSEQPLWLAKTPRHELGSSASNVPRQQTRNYAFLSPRRPRHGADQQGEAPGRCHPLCVRTSQNSHLPGFTQTAGTP
jgi:hypothetical protein